jgi:nitroimidazol reductase NimA-like FMN-containing flavoprotein (pyridoxamine 5'-phosphate oxidase superfamily)
MGKWVHAGVMVNQSSAVLRTTLSRADCIDLLGQATLARVVISVRCLPAALPARIAVVNDDQLLVASTEGAVILAARRGDVLSIQIDGLESDGSTWSVMASGLASLAAPTVAAPDSMREAMKRGATLLTLPLSVVVGERIG